MGEKPDAAIPGSGLSFFTNPHYKIRSMQKNALYLFCIAILLASCFKDKNDCALRNITVPSSEQLALADYLSNQGISATRHASGFYYQILQMGTGASPSICSSVKVGFIGRLTNGAEAESDDDLVLNLKLMLEGWRIALPMIKAGGKIKIWLPPSLAYGADGKKVGNTQVVPPHSMVYYDINLYEVQ